MRNEFWYNQKSKYEIVVCYFLCKLCWELIEIDANQMKSVKKWLTYLYRKRFTIDVDIIILNQAESVRIMIHRSLLRLARNFAWITLENQVWISERFKSATLCIDEFEKWSRCNQSNQMESVGKWLTALSIRRLT